MTYPLELLVGPRDSKSLLFLCSVIIIIVLSPVHCLSKDGWPSKGIARQRGLGVLSHPYSLLVYQVAEGGSVRDVRAKWMAGMDLCVGWWGLNLGRFRVQSIARVRAG